MNIYDYIKVVSVYVLSKIENKVDANNIEFKINAVKGFNSEVLYYEALEIENYKEKKFYLKFPCINKKEFYEAINSLFIENFRDNEKIAYTSIKPNNSLSFVSNNGITLSIGINDELDTCMFMEFKKYLDDCKRIMNDDNVKIVDDEKSLVKTFISTNDVEENKSVVI